MYVKKTTMAIIAKEETTCPDCGAELRSNGHRNGRQQFYCKGDTAHYHRSLLNGETPKPTPKPMLTSAGISEQEFRRQYDNRFILREAVKKLKEGTLLEQRKFVQGLRLQGTYKDILEEEDFEPFRGKISADKVFWSHPNTIAKLKEESLLR
jgi:hypothetical protein